VRGFWIARELALGLRAPTVVAAAAVDAAAATRGLRAGLAQAAGARAARAEAPGAFRVSAALAAAAEAAPECDPRAGVWLARTAVAVSGARVPADRLAAVVRGLRRHRANTAAAALAARAAQFGVRV